MSTFDPILSGTFTQDKTKAIISALSELTKIEIDKIVLEFKSSPKTLFINARNNIDTVFARVWFDPCILDGFDIKNDFEYGISDLGDLIGLMEIFKGEGFELKLSPDLLNMSSSDNFIDYYGANVKKIIKGPDASLKLKEEILSTIQCDEGFTEFITALGKVSHEHLIFKGNPSQNNISISIAHNKIVGNSFTKKINIESPKDFKVTVNKDYIRSIMDVGCNIKVYNIGLEINKIKNLFNVDYFISAERV